MNDNAGTTGFAALKTVHSARAIAMGQSLAGEARNPDGIHFNPAAILGIQNKEVGSTYTNSFLDTQGGQLQLLYPKHKFTAWGFALKYLDMGSFDRTEIDQNGDLIDMEETFGAFNLIASASLAKYISDALDAGGTLKVVYDQIDDSSAIAALIDLGIIHHPDNEKVKVGVSLRNLGAQLTYYSDGKYKEKLPFTIAAGLSYQFNPKLFSSLEIGKADGEDIVAKAGIEYAIHPSLDLRGGFRSNAGDGYNGGSLAFLSGFSLGAGWKWRNYRVDYGLSSYGDLGLVNQLSLSLEF
ncbi:MAG: PorV/PorQ family protein [Candidatus Syntrophosphaera sp.]|nr:PorV/PorQ family protein [Candidatus Syntrophosphaera sp.]